MANVYWTATGGGAFSNAADWNTGTVPQTSDTAVFGFAGGAVSGVGNVNALTFSVGVWTLIGQIAANSATISSNPASAQFAVTVTGSGAQLAVNGPFSVGGSGPAALVVSNSGQLAVTGGSSVFGSATLTVTSGGIAELGGAVALASGANASVTVDDALLAVGGVLSLGASAGATGALVVQNLGETVLNAGADASTPYLQLGAVAGSVGTATVSGGSTDLIVSSNSGAVGYAGNGALTVTGGGLARFVTSNNGQMPALLIGDLAGSGGTVTVNGGGSSLEADGSIIVGEQGTGIFQLLNGASVTASAITAAQAALAVAAAPGSVGSLTISGAGSQLTASGAALVGGDNRGLSNTGGGQGSVSLTNGGTLSAGAMTVFGGGSVSVDGSSELVVSGALLTGGTVVSDGTLSAGEAIGTGTLQLGGGIATLGDVTSANINFLNGSATLRIGAVNGQSNLGGITYGDTIDLVGQQATLYSGTTVVTGSGTLVLSGADPSLSFGLSSDGNGGTLVDILPGTVDVYRFFDTDYGTHFFTSETSEVSNIEATRPDLVYEGVGLQAVDPSADDPNASPVYRFFDTRYGTHFFTASLSERNAVMSTRPDLTYEGVGFYEHTVQQPGDTPVYRFFDSVYGTHFYTDDASEKATISATRPDLIYEGIGFYAPS